MNFHFKTLTKNRQLIINLTKNLTEAQLNKIPQGFNNNIAWNVVHLLVTQELLCYKLSGLNLNISELLVNDFRKGTKPLNYISKLEFDEISKNFLKLSKKLENDYNSDVFKVYNEYTTSLNVTLTSISDAITFNTFHEGIHLGIIVQLLKLI